MGRASPTATHASFPMSCRASRCGAPLQPFPRCAHPHAPCCSHALWPSEPPRPCPPDHCWLLGDRFRVTRPGVVILLHLIHKDCLAICLSYKEAQLELCFCSTQARSPLLLRASLKFGSVGLNQPPQSQADSWTGKFSYLKPFQLRGAFDTGAGGRSCMTCSGCGAWRRPTC